MGRKDRPKCDEETSNQKSRTYLVAGKMEYFRVIYDSSNGFRYTKTKNQTKLFLLINIYHAIFFTLFKIAYGV